MIKMSERGEERGEVFYTSRSAIQTYQLCKQKRFLNYHYQGRGIVPVYSSVPLTTGTCVHTGIAFLLGHYKNDVNLDKEIPIEQAVSTSITSYKQLLESKPFKIVDENKDEVEYRIKEQLALTEALVRVWTIIELPQLLRRFRVLEVEREIEIPLTDSIILQVRVDAELQDRENGQIYAYSLKTIKTYDEREEKSYAKDLQGLTEIYGLEQDAIQANKWIKTYEDLSKGFIESSNNERLKKAHTRLLEIYATQYKPDRIQGVKYCFLIKGKMYKGSGGFYKVSSPLIKGYKQFSANSMRYAHSWEFPNPMNKSGKGNLGSKWDGFDVWNEEGLGKEGERIKKWIEMLATGEIQPECGDVLRSCVVTPQEYFRDAEDMGRTIEEIRYQEELVRHNLFYDDTRMFEHPEGFSRNRGACHYPTDCEYLGICFPTGQTHEISKDPVRSGAFTWREPHHIGEMEQHKRLYDIGGVNVDGTK